MKSAYSLLFLLSFLLTACLATTEAPMPVRLPLSTLTQLPDISPSHTATNRVAAPSHTPSIATTQTHTPEVASTSEPSRNPNFTATSTTRPAITPTFDVAKIITRTSAPPAQCPMANPELTPDIASWQAEVGYQVLLQDPILDFLNSGGTPDAVIHAFMQEFTRSWLLMPALQRDLTGDSINELIITNGHSALVFGCNQGVYKTLLQDSGTGGNVRFVRFEMPGDMNLNGIPEIIINEQTGTINGYHRIVIYEWDGQQLTSIILAEEEWDGKHYPVAYMDGATKIAIQDMDHNGTLEMSLTGSIPFENSSGYVVGLPWRRQTDIYTWNGSLFVLYRVEYSPPEYRFQAVQDGDRATLLSEYDRALEFYQQAIFSDELEWWSEDRWRYEVRSRSAIETPDPTPIPDPTDYYNLAAYARFRIMLLHLSRGYLPEAEIVFNTLKEKFPHGQPGYAYVEMASAFWEEFQASASLTQACNQAIEYAAQHPVEILSYLGNGEYARTYYGEQSLEYKPADACPFHP